MKKIYTSVFLTLLIASCDSPAKQTSEEKPAPNHLKNAEWLIGRWENNSPDGNLSETWEKDGDMAFMGESYFVIAGDTVFEEHIRLTQTEDGLVYSPTIPGENNGKPIDFTLKHASEKEMVFENPKHDFPTKITYMLKGDSLIATISGKRAGREEKEVFAMKKR